MLQYQITRDPCVLTNLVSVLQMISINIQQHEHHVDSFLIFTPWFEHKTSYGFKLFQKRPRTGHSFPLREKRSILVQFALIGIRVMPPLSILLLFLVLLPVIFWITSASLFMPLAFFTSIFLLSLCRFPFLVPIFLLVPLSITRSIFNSFDHWCICRQTCWTCIFFLRGCKGAGIFPRSWCPVQSCRKKCEKKYEDKLPIKHKATKHIMVEMVREKKELTLHSQGREPTLHQHSLHPCPLLLNPSSQVQ